MTIWPIPCALSVLGQKNEKLSLFSGLFSTFAYLLQNNNYLLLYYYKYPQAKELPSATLLELLSARYSDLAVCKTLLLVYAVSYSLRSANGLENTSGKSIILSVCTERAASWASKPHPKISSAGQGQRQAIELDGSPAYEWQL